MLLLLFWAFVVVFCFRLLQCVDITVICWTQFLQLQFLIIWHVLCSVSSPPPDDTLVDLLSCNGAFTVFGCCCCCCYCHCGWCMLLLLYRCNLLWCVHWLFYYSHLKFLWNTKKQPWLFWERLILIIGYCMHFFMQSKKDSVQYHSEYIYFNFGSCNTLFLFYSDFKYKYILVYFL